MSASTKHVLSAALAAAMLAMPVAAKAEVKPADLIAGIISAQMQSELRKMEEQQVWAAAEQSATAQAYRNYLSVYPQGPHAATAKARLKALGAAAPAPAAPVASGPAQAEADLGLTRAERARMQSRLTALGYNTRGVDGSFGRGTRSAIATWQRDRGDSVTGYLTPAQVKVLNVAAAEPVTPDTPAATDTAAAARVEYNLGLSRADRAMVQRTLTALGYDTRGADGVFGSGTRKQIAAWQKASKAEATGYLTAAQFNALKDRAGTPAVDNTASESAMDRARIEEGLVGLNRSERAEVQRALSALGYNTRGTDGVFGSGTRVAIKRWQAATGKAATGYLDGDQVQELRAAAPGAPAVDTDTQAWAAAKAKDTVAAYRAYLDAWPRGANAGAARDRIAALEGDAAQVEAWKASEAAMGMDTATRQLVETRLAAAGFNPGKADGVFDSSTRAALKAYQKAKGLPQTGYINQGTAVSLMSDVILR